MTASHDDLFAYFDSLGIAHKTRWHDPVFTVEEGRELKASLPGAHTKNLFLKDKAGECVLIAAEAHSDIRLNQLHKLIGTKRLSFGSAELMQQTLGVTPGSVTAFALINAGPDKVRFLVDEALTAFDVVNFHPLTNTGTTALSQTDFRAFVAATGHNFEVIDFTSLISD